MTRKTTTASERRPPAETLPSTDEKDSDWGFEQGGREKVIEPKLGIALAVCLLLVFGFVVYQKYQTLSGGILQAAAEGSAPTEPDVSGAASESSDFANKAADREEFYPPSDSAISSAVPRGQSSVSDPFASREPTSADPWQEQEAAPSSGHASLNESSRTPTDHPFGVPPEPQERADFSSAPPAQDEPSPFEVPADFGEPAEPPPRPSSRFAEAQPFFEEEPAAEASAPRDDNEPLFADDEPSPQPAATDWDPGAAPELAANKAPETGVNEPEESDPFAAPVEPQAGAFEWAPPQSAPAEPQGFETAEVEVPLETQEPPDNPFAAPDLLPAPSDAAADADPFGEFAASETSPNQRPPEPPDLSDWSSVEGSDRGLTSPSPGEPLTSAPELPALAAPPSHPFGDEETEPEPSTAAQLLPTPDEPPLLELPPASTSGEDEQPFSAAAGPRSIITERTVIGERMITIKRNDTLWSISQDAYGTARYVSALARYNQDRVPRPELLKAGDQIRVPPPEVLEAQFPELFRRPGHRDPLVSPAGGSSSLPAGASQPGLHVDMNGRPLYVVGRSDTLSRIAQQCLGRASRWTEILAMNGDRLTNPKTLKPGMVLRLPADAARIAVGSDGPFSR